MDGLGINQKIRFGYAKAASKLGQPFDLYRSALSIDPISPGNFVGTLKAVFTIDWEWMKSNKPGNCIWWAVVDGRDSSYPLTATEGDYLVGDSTYFILTKEYQMPMSAVQCNSTVNIVRPYQSIQPGDQGYIAYPDTAPTIIASQLPISLLKLSSGGKVADSRLPTDTIKPTFIVQMPNLGDIKIITGDIIIDELNVQYVIGVQERSEFGWRLTAEQVVNN